MIVNRCAIALFSLGLLASCDAGAGRIDGPYLLDVVDVVEDASVCYELRNGDCAGRIPQTVFAVGYNQEFIVAARHPHEFENRSLDRSRTEYFYIIRSLDGEGVYDERAVRGPFDLATFEQHRRRFNLPQFSREISNLR